MRAPFHRAVQKRLCKEHAAGGKPVPTVTGACFLPDLSLTLPPFVLRALLGCTRLPL